MKMMHNRFKSASRTIRSKDFQIPIQLPQVDYLQASYTTGLA